VPINPKTGGNASTTKPETWSSFQTAQNRSRSSDLDGIGYVFADDHIGIDLDNAIDATGTIKAWATEILQKIPTYTEKSPSGMGLHLITSGSLPADWTGTKRVFHDGAVEIYSRARFFTITGDLVGEPFSELCDYSPTVKDLYKQIGGNIPSNGNGNGHYPASRQTPVRHDDVHDRLQIALRNSKFERLWSGDTSGYNNDDSAADLALCNKLAFYFGHDHGVIDRLFRQSGLNREKWEKRADYRQQTIDKAIAATSETYSPKRQLNHTRHVVQTIEIDGPNRINEEANDDQSKPSATLKNAVRTIEDRRLIDVHYDEFLCRMITGNTAKEWTDHDDLELNITLQAISGFSKIGIDVTRNAALTIAFRNRTNCVKDWLDSLEWDHEPRIDHFFEDCFGAVGSAYTRAASKNFLISMVARIYYPGCQSDHMVVLEGPQGIGKSAALRDLGGQWFTEQHESATGKAFFEVLQGKWLVEISEMDSFNRAEVTKVKQIVTCTNDRFREPYGRHAKDHYRQCIFVGTTNRDDWNRDETGARRFWPIACNGEVDLDGIRASRNQLFAEAVHRFNASESWWEMPAEETLAEQEARFEADPWTPFIDEFIRTKDRVLIAEILVDGLKVEVPQIMKRDQMRVATCLCSLGWKKGKPERYEGKAVRFWRPK
jgi:predicted P-loop ATPase